MAFSRREFMQWAASTSTLALLAPGTMADGATQGYRPKLMPTREEIWAWQVWMAKLGPKYTGNEAHGAFVDFLAKELKATGLDVVRDQVKFTRWNARRWAISVSPASGAPFKIPVSSYFPYSGQTPASGVTGELVYVGVNPALNLSGDLRGKVVFVDCPIQPRPYGEWYQTWGVYPEGTTLPAQMHRMTHSSLNSLEAFKKAGAAAVILGWTDASDANAADQYTPFSEPLQDIPGLWVGHETGSKLRALAGSGAKATVILEADLIPDSPTDHVIATLPGASEEVIIVNTHTDGPNATEENGGVGIVSLAKYFSRIPRSERKRTIVFLLATGHLALPYVPSIEGIIQKHPEIISKAVAAVTVEHLGAMEWLDDAALNYKPTGKNELSLVISPNKSTADVMLDCVQGTGDIRTVVVNPYKGLGFIGEGGALAKAGVPTMGHIPVPNYLVAGPADGCISKLNRDMMAVQIATFARVIHKLDGMSAAELKT